MLKLDDRISVALNNGMGIQLSADEVTRLAGVLVYFRQSKAVNVMAQLKLLFKE